MAERFQFTPAGESRAPEWMLDQLLAPGSGYGYTRDQGKSRGGVRSELIDPLGLLGTGSEQYGLTAWDDLFGEGGQIANKEALLRSLNFGNVVAQEGSRGNPGDRGGFDWEAALAGSLPGSGKFLSSHRPGPGEIAYDESNPLQAWLRDISYEGKNRGRSWTGRHKTDVPGYWYDPQALRFDEQDLAGIQTMEDLDAWAMENYGIDAQTLGAMSDDLLQTRQEWMDDPSLWWNDGMLDVTGNIPGLQEADAQARLAGLMEEYQAREAAQQNQYAQQLLNMATGAAAGNRHLGRSTYGQALAALVPEGVQSPMRRSALGQPGVGFDYGLTEALRPYLEDIQMDQYRYA